MHRGSHKTHLLDNYIVLCYINPFINVLYNVSTANKQTQVP